ncbi:hypothetical protein D7V21_09590 [Acinetobacter guerrae]|uniref:Uncharacterized protein n=1 Tax=Acinetobacter guerrae TaxID=1843371 RepID=A0A3A8EFQ8_9GAMM|nr:hypothetical protein [Acinetobacter guerrae]RKG33415.1 hypothetical protein D7V21_09590 [Acinetobacter guerrae]
MNAHKFVAEHGVEEAKRVLEGAPEGAELFHTNTYIKNAHSEGHTDYLARWSDGFKDWVNASADREFINESIDLSELKQVVESVEIVNKFDNVQQATDAIKNAPEGATDYRKLSCSTRYIKQSERFFEWWDGGNWRRPTAPFTDETHILRFTELSRLEKAIADYEIVESYKENQHV